MNVFKCVCVGIVAILLCGCFESRAEFNALNLGKVNALYENGALKIMPHCDGKCSKQSSDSQQSAKFANEAKQRFAENQKDNTPFILFFFTSTCGVCKVQIPILQEIVNESANNGARIYAILGNAPDRRKAVEYANANAMSLPLFYESGAKRFFSQIVGGVKGVPVVVVFDKDGKIKERFIGLTPKSVLKSTL